VHASAWKTGVQYSKIFPDATSAIRADKLNDMQCPASRAFPQQTAWQSRPLAAGNTAKVTDMDTVAASAAA